MIKLNSDLLKKALTLKEMRTLKGGCGFEYSTDCVRGLCNPISSGGKKCCGGLLCKNVTGGIGQCM